MKQKKALAIVAGAFLMAREKEMNKEFVTT